LLRLGGTAWSGRFVQPISSPLRPRNGHLNSRRAAASYSNTNFLLLGLIIERLTKQKLGR